MHTFLPRVTALFLAGLIVTVLEMAGIPMAAEDHARLIDWLSVSLTGAGTLTLLLSYGVGHRLLSRLVNPGDVAAPPEQIPPYNVHRQEPHR